MTEIFTNFYYTTMYRWQKEFESYISIASSVPSAVTVVTHAFVGNRFSVNKRAIISIVRWN